MARLHYCIRYVCLINVLCVWNSPVIVPLLLHYVRFAGFVAVLFFSPELVELCRRAWVSSCRLPHMRTVKMDYAKILTHARYSVISDIYGEPRLADNSCPAY